MSLINDALKKAQKQRTGDAPSLTAMPSVGGESAARIARRGKPAGFNTLIAWISLGVVALAVVIVGAVFLLRPKAPAPTAPVTASAPTPSASTPSATDQGFSYAAVPPAPPRLAPSPSATAVPNSGSLALPAAPQSPALAVVAPNGAPAHAMPVVPASASPTVVSAPTPLVVAPTEPSRASAAVQLPPEARPAASASTRKFEPRAIKYIDSIRVAGIRASANDSKVLMNDRVYRIGDIVEAEMGLKLAGIATNALTFEDENGARYTRNF